MVKKIVMLFVVLLVVLGAGSFFYLDAIAKSGIEVVGSKVLGTGVTVSSVSLSPLSGSGGLTDLQIENPAGFSADYIFELGYVSVNIDVSSVFSDVIEIELVTIAQPIITYETRLTNDNVRTLLANLPGSDNGASNNEAAGGDGGKRVIIRELQILDPQLNFSAGIVSAPLQLPNIILHDIGTEDDSASIAQALREVLAALSTSILRADLPNLDSLRESVETKLQDGVNQAVDSAVENLGNRLRNIVN